jgi:hypothetical protein
MKYFISGLFATAWSMEFHSELGEVVHCDISKYPTEIHVPKNLQVAFS